MEISFAELRQLMDKSTPLPDKTYGWIVLILRNGFVFVGDTRREAGIGFLRGYQVRYWALRAGGLPEFARDGRKSEDKLDLINGELEFMWSEANVIGVMPCGLIWTE